MNSSPNAGTAKYDFIVTSQLGTQDLYEWI